MVYMFSRSTQMACGVSKRGAAALNSVRVHIHEVVESKCHGFVYTQYQRFICLHRWGHWLLLLMELQNSLSVYVINRKLMKSEKRDAHIIKFPIIAPSSSLEMVSLDFDTIRTLLLHQDRGDYKHCRVLGTQQLSFLEEKNKKINSINIITKKLW